MRLRALECVLRDASVIQPPPINYSQRNNCEAPEMAQGSETVGGATI